MLTSNQADSVQDSLLAVIQNHTKSVNIVRWSRDGKYLASGSDDNVVLIYKHSQGMPSTQPFGRQAQKSKVNIILK